MVYLEPVDADPALERFFEILSKTPARNAVGYKRGRHEDFSFNVSGLIILVLSGHFKRFNKQTVVLKSIKNHFRIDTTYY